jgi:hypothetical protein
MPSDMEGHRLEPVDELDDPMQGRGVAGNRQHDAFGSASLFKQYLATVAAKSRFDSMPVPVAWYDILIAIGGHN